ncbi:MAG: chromate transporter, partial [Clostridiales bacterium]|nr:chromate transporter [Clostridiales bacterium]
MDKKKLWILFYTMFMISAFTLGGGYVMVTLIKKKYVD